MLTKADDYPIHQLPIPVSEVGRKEISMIGTFSTGITKKATSFSLSHYVFTPI
ncbi:MAG: hypothetical protein CM1200mP12_04950 [Gammaproteobacteria bacterium]|nr:MAG: hypothetical protein CM1200mP12_04950 [Gammaproteobacteria bacterium]